MAKVEKDKKDLKQKPAKKRTGLLRYFKEVGGELKKVTWSTRKELVSNTLTVLAFVVLMAAIIYVLDLVFSGALGLLTQ